MCTIFYWGDLGNLMWTQCIEEGIMYTSFGGIVKKFILVPLTNKKTNFKTEGNNFLIIMKAHLKKDCDGCKKLEKKDEFKVKTVSKEV